MSTRTLFHKLVILFLIASLAEQLGHAGGFSFRNKRRKTFRKGLGSTISVNRGDTVITNVWPNPKYIRPGPYRWHYAVTPKILVHFLPRFTKIMSSVRPTLIDISTFSNKKIEDRGQKDPHATGLAGSLVGALMIEYGKAQKRIPFNIFYCHCKHYVEYLSLGKVKGSWGHPMYKPVNKKCATYAKLEESMAGKIYHDKAFQLLDAHGKPYELQVDQWPDYIIEMINSSEEYKNLISQVV